MKKLVKIASSSELLSAICTIAEVKGSAPRRVGAKMLVFENGEVHGTIGGGNLEKRVIENAITQINKNETLLFTHDLLGHHNMCCGGVVKIFIEPIMKTNKLEKIRKKTKLPDELSSVIISIFILILIVSISLGPSFIFEQVHNVKSSLIQPIENRFSLTVAENKQPYFLNDWRNNFGPIVFNIPLFFWLFFIGSVLLFNNMIKKLKSALSSVG